MDEKGDEAIKGACGFIEGRKGKTAGGGQGGSQAEGEVSQAEAQGDPCQAQAQSGGRALYLAQDATC
jgi:hypothetical protein